MKKCFFEPNVGFVFFSDKVLLDSQSVSTKGVYEKNPKWFEGN